MVMRNCSPRLHPRPARPDAVKPCQCRLGSVVVWDDGAMDVILRLTGETAGPDALRSLREWLLEEGLHGRVETLERAPDPGALGPVLDGLRVIAESATAVLIPVLLAWIRSRTGKVKLVMTFGEGRTAELDAQSVRGLDASAVAELTRSLVARLESAEQGDDALPAQPEERS